MNSVRLNIALRFIVLVLVQVLIFNRIDFLGYINPYPYIIFILLYPTENNRVLFLVLSFLLGLTVDLFTDSGGVHTAACVFAAYIRPVVLKSSFGMMYEHQTVKFSNSEFGSLFGYIAIITILHHFMLFLLEIFNIGRILSIFKESLVSGIFTIILSVLIVLLFSRKSK